MVICNLISTMALGNVDREVIDAQHDTPLV